MTAQTFSPSQTSAPALPGTWKLRGGRAITLQPREDGDLRVAPGSLWATFDGPHGGPLNDSGDHFVEVGDTVRIAAGQRVVVESWDGQAPAYFSWDPQPSVALVPRLRIADALQPLDDLRLALLLGARALGRLAAGLGRLAVQAVVPPRPVAASGMCVHCKA